MLGLDDWGNKGTSDLFSSSGSHSKNTIAWMVYCGVTTVSGPAVLPLLLIGFGNFGLMVRHGHKR